MCGICGIINFNNNPVNEFSLKAMMQTMKHRGPDDEGTFVEENTGLGFIRLSIIDLTSAGHQPMYSDDGKYVMVFNGEIYNYIELRKELKVKGYVFKTKTDSEVLLKSYIEWKGECLHKFNGMWAFVIYNRHDKTVFAARDRFGIKPFYYFTDDKQFIFASEIPPILKVLQNKPKADNQSIFDYLVFNRTDQTEATFFDGIKKLQHGHQLAIDTRYSSLVTHHLKISKWYDLRSHLKNPFQSPEEFREAFHSSINFRLRSDVPVGVCFSGGLDSSSIISVLLKDFNKRDLNTFSAVYEKGQFGNESEFIDEYKSQLKNMYYTIPSAESLYSDMYQFVKAHGEPIPTTSPYAQYKVMELAKKNVVVTLDGQGADEELAGYHYFFGLFFKDLLIHCRIVKLSTEIIAYLNKHHSLYGLKSFLYFLLPKVMRTEARVLEKGYLKKEFVKQNGKGNTIATNLYASRSLHDALLDHFEYKLEHLLKWEDRNSMWFSLEARVPFLDYRLVEQILTLPAKYVINKGMTKYILREAMKGTLPEKIRMRKDKIGFGTPQGKWFRTELFRKYIIDLLNSESLQSRGFIDIRKVKALYQKHLDRKIDVSNEIWKWINLELWLKEFVD